MFFILNLVNLANPQTYIKLAVVVIFEGRKTLKSIPEYTICPKNE